MVGYLNEKISKEKENTLTVMKFLPLREDIMKMICCSFKNTWEKEGLSRLTKSSLALHYKLLPSPRLC